MARKRMIDPNFWRDEKVAKCSPIERLLFIGLWNFAEDTGVGRANPKLIKADIFPYDTLRDSDIEKSLDKLSSLELIQLYTVDSQSYYIVSNFHKHQKINRPSAGTLPLVGEDIPKKATLTEHSVSAHGEVTPKLIEVNRIYIVEYLNEKTGKSFKPNTKATVSAINARFDDGFTVEDFVFVIDDRTNKWANDPKMAEYLRPSTLFGAKFEGYLNSKAKTIVEDSIYDRLD